MAGCLNVTGTRTRARYPTATDRGGSRMRYLWPQAGDVSHLPPQYGIMTRPSDKTIAQGIRAGRSFAVDNEAFTRGFKPERFFPFLERLRPYVAKTVYDLVR